MDCKWIANGFKTKFWIFILITTYLVIKYGYFVVYFKIIAEVAELVDALVSGASS